MKHVILLSLLALSVTANATDRRPQANAGAAALAGSQATGGGGSSDTRSNFLVLPSTTAAAAASGNTDIVCQIITVKSEAKQFGFGLYSNSEIGTEPATVNGICVLYHKAKDSGTKADWDNFIAYARKVDPVLDDVMKGGQ